MTRLLLARFPGGYSEVPDVGDYLYALGGYFAGRPDWEVLPWRMSTTPVTRARNLAAKAALWHRCDLVLMVDSDMRPSETFLRAAVDHWESSGREVAVYASPYCGAPPAYGVMAFRWDCREGEFYLDQYARSEVHRKTGWERVGAAGTGLMLIDARVFDALPRPYFYYEWKSDEEGEMACTEDVTFTRDCAFAGVPVLVGWDHWSGHHKAGMVEKPSPYSPNMVGRMRPRNKYESLPPGVKCAATGLREGGAGGGRGVPEIGRDEAPEGDWLAP